MAAFWIPLSTSNDCRSEGTKTLDMERLAADWMTKGGRLHRSLPPLFRPVNSSLFTQSVSDSSLFVLHSSLKEYRILHSSFFTLHSRVFHFVTQMDTRFMSFWLNGCTVEPLCPVVTREASMPYSVVSAFFTAAARCSDRRSLMAFVPVPASA